MNSGGDPEESIYGIMFEKFPATPKSDRKYFIMVSTLRYRGLHTEQYFAHLIAVSGLPRLGIHDLNTVFTVVTSNGWGGRNSFKSHKF